MVGSDDDYVDDDDDIQAPGGRLRGGGNNHSKGARTLASDRDVNFSLTRTWENVAEGADGTITGAVEGLAEAEKRKR